MPTSADAPGERILSSWRRLAHRPGGRWLFSKLLGRMVPYTGALGAQIVELTPGRTVVVLRDRRGVRNHLRSIHAVALANLCELASGTAMLTALPAGVRGIVTHLEITYLKKARGTLTATADVVIPPVIARTELKPEATVTDAAGDVVATARVTWKVEPGTAEHPAAPASDALGAAR